MWPFRKKKISDARDQKLLEGFGLLAIVSSHCIGPDRLPVLHAIRETPNNVSDSGWIFSSGRESPEFSSEAANHKLVPLERMISDDPTLAPLRDFAVGAEAVRRQPSEPWRFIVNNKVVDADGRVVGDVR